MSDSRQLLPEIPLPWQHSQWQSLASQMQNQQLAHAYLIAGAGGLGKKLFTERFSQLLLCNSPQGGMPCEECKNCLLGSTMQHPDLLRVSPEDNARDIKVDQIREVAQFLSRTSHAGGAKVVIVDRAHQMNVSAANALLKTLEEPHPNNYLFLATDSPGALMATVRSRCQRLQFHTPGFEESLDWLRVNLVGEEDEVKLLVAANNHPVRAIELAQSGAYEAQQAFITTLCDLLIGNQSVSQGVNQAGKLGEDSAVGYLLNTSTILIKNLLGESQQQGGDYVSLLGISELLRESDQDKKYQIACLLAFYESALVCRQRLQSSTNPNPQLIMESLLWRWHQLPLGIRA